MEIRDNLENLCPSYCVEQLVKGMADQMIENQYQQLIPQFIINDQYGYVDNVLRQNYLKYQKESDIEERIDMECEPICQSQDSWNRNQIINQENLLNSKCNMSNNVMDTSSIDSNQFNEILKHERQQFKKQKTYEPQMLQQGNGDFDVKEESLRLQKERENNLLEQNKLKMRQQQFKQNFNEGEKKNRNNFTYDYDGNIVLVQQIRPDKLPSNITHLKFKSYQQQDQQSIQTIPNKKENAKVQSNKSEKNDEQNIKYVQKPPPVYDLINPKPGVIFISGNQTKEGPKELEKYNISSIAQLQEDPTIKLSKTDYKRITQQGFTKIENIPTIIDNQSVHSNTTGIHNSKMLMKGSQSMRVLPINIKIENQLGLQEMMTQDQEEKRVNFPKLDMKNEKQQNLVDEFNIKILNSQRWGVAMSQNAQIVKLKPTKSDLQQKNFEKLNKLPRDRQKRNIINLKPK